MKKLIYANSFWKDLKRMKKRGKNIEKLYTIVEYLRKDKPLPQKHVPHPLKGNWKPKWDCHIEPDWLLIYEVTATEILLVRTGSHVDLF